MVPPARRKGQAGGLPAPPFKLHQPPPRQSEDRPRSQGLQALWPSSQTHILGRLQGSVVPTGANPALLKGLCEVGLEAGTPGCWGAQQFLPSPPEKSHEVLLRRKVHPHTNTAPSPGKPPAAAQPAGARSTPEPRPPGAGRDPRVVSRASCPVWARGHPAGQWRLGWGPHHLVSRGFVASTSLVLSERPGTRLPSAEQAGPSCQPPPRWPCP